MNTNRILHISDLHIDLINYPFFKSLTQYLSLNFVGANAIQYLIISGDLGNKCEPENIKKAGEWIIDLINILNISPEHIILCAGNHDLNTKIDDVKIDHSDKCSW